jgi:acyl-CoA thioester hydrolase
VKTRNMSFFALEMHVRYLREVHLQDPMQVRIQILDLDEKRIHYWMELVHAGERWLSATMESISLHIDMGTRRSTPFPPDIMARLAEWRGLSDQRGRPEGVGQTIGIRRKG